MIRENLAEFLRETFSIENHQMDWAIFGIALVVTYFIFALFKRILWTFIEKLTLKTNFTWDDQVLNLCKTPLSFLFFFFSLRTSLEFAPKALQENHFMQAFIKVAVVLCLSWLVSRVMKLLVKSLTVTQSLSRGTQLWLIAGIQIFVVTMGALIALDSVGISITPIIASLGIGSAAIALALQDTLGNLFSGFYLLMDEPIRVGDFIRTEEGLEGQVVKIGWRSTTLRLLSNNMVIIPNNKLATSIVTNFQMPEPELSLIVEVGVAYGSDLELVETVSRDTALEVLKRMGQNASQEPAIRFFQFADSSINLKIILRVKGFEEQFLVRHELIKEIHKQYAHHKIEIPFPQRTVHLLQ